MVLIYLIINYLFRYRAKVHREKREVSRAKVEIKTKQRKNNPTKKQINDIETTNQTKEKASRPILAKPNKHQFISLWKKNAAIYHNSYRCIFPFEHKYSVFICLSKKTKKQSSLFYPKTKKKGQETISDILRTAIVELHIIYNKPPLGISNACFWLEAVSIKAKKRTVSKITKFYSIADN